VPILHSISTTKGQKQEIYRNVLSNVLEEIAGGMAMEMHQVLDFGENGIDALGISGWV